MWVVPLLRGVSSRMKAYAIIFVDKTGQIKWARVCSAFPVAQANMDVDQLCIGRADDARKLRRSLVRRHPWLEKLFRARQDG